jgi:hypothetical protein
MTGRSLLSAWGRITTVEQRARRGIVHDDACKSAQTQEILRYCMVNLYARQERKRSADVVFSY